MPCIRTHELEGRIISKPRAPADPVPHSETAFLSPDGDAPIRALTLRHNSLCFRSDTSDVFGHAIPLVSPHQSGKKGKTCGALHTDFPGDGKYKGGPMLRQITSRTTEKKTNKACILSVTKHSFPKQEETSQNQEQPVITSTVQKTCAFQPPTLSS